MKRKAFKSEPEKKIIPQESSSESEAEVIFQTEDKNIKFAKNGETYYKWKLLHTPSEEDDVETHQQPLFPIITQGTPVFRRSLPIVAPNYTYWADLIFEPSSRDSGVVLVVEGTSRWCWFQYFPNKRSDTIKGIMRNFMNVIAGRITSLVTDAGNEWAKMNELSQEFGFTWYKKNVAVVGHGGMARLDRTVRTLRYFMQIFSLYMPGWNWYQCFSKAVEMFNKDKHSFSDIPPEQLIRHPNQMHFTRLYDYRTWPNYSDIMPYIEDKHREYYAEVDPENNQLRYKYKTFRKGKDRHVFDKHKRKIAYVIGNKFLLDGDPKTSNYLYDARQLLPVETYENDIKGREIARHPKFRKMAEESGYMTRYGVSEDYVPPPKYASDHEKYNMDNF